MCDYLYRLETTLNFLGQSLNAISLLNKFEMLVVDWASTNPLCEHINLSSELEEFVKFIYIEKHDADRIGYNNDCIPPSLLLNIAIRRSKGEYIFVMGSDTILLKGSLYLLHEICKKSIKLSSSISNSYITIGRKHIPWDYIQKKPNCKQLENFITYNGHNFRDDLNYLKWGGGTGLIGMHCHSWNKIEGLDERILYYGANDVEIFILAMNYFDSIELSTQGVLSYHMEHNPETICNKYKYKNYDIFKENRISNKNWGLPKSEFKIHKYNIRKKTKNQISVSQKSYRTINYETLNYAEIAHFIANIERIYQDIYFSKYDIRNISLFIIAASDNNIENYIFGNSYLNKILLFIISKLNNTSNSSIYCNKHCNIFGDISEFIKNIFNICSFRGNIKFITKLDHIVDISSEESMLVLDKSLHTTLKGRFSKSLNNYIFLNFIINDENTNQFRIRNYTTSLQGNTDWDSGILINKCYKDDIEKKLHSINKIANNIYLYLWCRRFSSLYYIKKLIKALCLCKN